MEEALLDIVSNINSVLSNYVLLFLLIGTGLFFSIRTGFVQFRCFGEGWKRLFGGLSLSGGNQGGAMSSFQSLATAVAAQVGTGNIVGVSGAILIGGPGALFWMWIIAILGMATNYAEATLAQKTKVVSEDGKVLGGPAYYISTAFKGGFGKFLSGFFAFAIIIALGCIGCMVQANSIAETMTNAFGIPGWAIGLLLALVGGFIFIGNMHRLASVTEKIVPIMAVIYLIGALIILILNAQGIPQTFALIFSCAFNPEATLGGVVFGIVAALSQGAKRGLFSNEAGMGSTPHAHALANVKDPHHQGVVAMIGVFIDTIIVATVTGLVVICVLYTNGGPLDNAYEVAKDCTTVTEFVEKADNPEKPYSIAEGLELKDGELVNTAKDKVVLTDDDLKDPAALGAAVGIQKTNMAQLSYGKNFTANGGNIFIAICLLFFAFSTIIAWNMFAKLNVEWLFRKGNAKMPVLVFCVIGIAFVFMGTVLQNDLVWELQDMFNQLMVLPNAVALIALSGFVVKCAKARGTKTDEINDMKL